MLNSEYISVLKSPRETQPTLQLIVKFLTHQLLLPYLFTGITKTSNGNLEFWVTEKFGLIESCVLEKKFSEITVTLLWNVNCALLLQY